MNSTDLAAPGSQLSRRFLLMGAGAIGAMTAAPAVLAGRGVAQVRRIRMNCAKTGESIDTIYWFDGQYIREAMYAIDYFMRDWRAGNTLAIDAKTIDIVAAVHNLLDTEEPIELISGYRTLATNRMLQRSADGVATNSLHMRGMAADIQLRGRSTTQIAKAAKRCRAGGVGTYSGSGFVHVDCGRVRSWGV